MVYNLDSINYNEIIDITNKILIEGKVAVLPTDTVYGLSGDYFNPLVRERIVKIKKRTFHKAFIVLVADKDALLECSNQEIPLSILKLLPASLTLIVKNRYHHLYNEESIAIRIPEHPFLTKLLSKVNIPIISTSANISGENIINTKDEIIKCFTNKVDLIVLEEDKGIITNEECPKPSTILDITSKPFRILREGDFIIPEGLLY